MAEKKKVKVYQKENVASKTTNSNKKKWIILGSALGGVVLLAGVLTPVLLVPNIYKVNDVKSFVQKYTPIRSNTSYSKMSVGSHPSAKLLFFSFIYDSVLGGVEFTNVKTNGLHNSLSFSIVDGGETEHLKVSYSNSRVTITGTVDQETDSEYLNKNEWRVDSETEEYTTLKGPMGAEDEVLICPIWGTDGNLDWTIL